MSLSSRDLQLHHPWLWIFGSVCGFVLLLGLFCLPVWGWIELRFSPVQRHYLLVYFQSSVGVLAGSEPQDVQWIDKKGPGRAWEIAEPEDLVPTTQDYPPFQLSPTALARGWTDLGYTSGGTFEQRDIRDTLQARIFDGHGLLFFVLQPFEVFLIGFLCWSFFDRWREQQARKRGAKWGVGPQFGPWDEDLKLFLKQLAQETGEAAVQTWKWVAARQQSLSHPGPVAVAGATVSPSQHAESVQPIPSPSKPKTVAPAAVKMTEVAPVRSSKPAVPVGKPSQAASPKPQLLKPQPAAKPEPSSPFGKPAAESEPASKWDISQWID